MKFLIYSFIVSPFRLAVNGKLMKLLISYSLRMDIELVQASSKIVQNEIN